MVKKNVLKNYLTQIFGIIICIISFYLFRISSQIHHYIFSVLLFIIGLNFFIGRFITQDTYYGTDRISNLDEDKIQLLILEYKECNNGYNNRDLIIQDEFAKLITIFGVLTGFITVFNSVFGHSDFLLFFNLFLGGFGIISLGAIFIDLEANVSCRKALRDRCNEIELELKQGEKDILKIWTKEYGVIDSRSRFPGEIITKKTSKILDLISNYLISNKSDRNTIVEASSDLYIWSGKILFFLWIILIIVVIFTGDDINFIGHILNL